MFARAALVAVFASAVCFLLSLCERSIANTPRYSVQLGDLAYNIEEAKAPTLGGPALIAFAWFATQTPFGHLLRRHLLLDNGVTQLRELAAQMPGTAPLHYPMLRLNEGQKRAHQDAVSAAQEAEVRMSDLAVFPDHPSLTSETSEVLALHAAYKIKGGKNSPATVAAKILAAFPALQAKYRPFSSHPLQGSLEAAAAASTARYAAGAPLSVWDGVPVAFKDMVPIEGYVLTDGSASNQAGTNRTRDDLLVERFRELGALVLPPTSMTEGGVTPVGYSTYVRGALNPYDPSRYSGEQRGLRRRRRVGPRARRHRLRRRRASERPRLSPGSSATPRASEGSRSAPISTARSSRRGPWRGGRRMPRSPSRCWRAIAPSTTSTGKCTTGFGARGRPQRLLLPLCSLRKRRRRQC